MTKADTKKLYPLHEISYDHDQTFLTLEVLEKLKKEQKGKKAPKKPRKQ